MTTGILVSVMMRNDRIMIESSNHDVLIGRSSQVGIEDAPRERKAGKRTTKLASRNANENESDSENGKLELELVALFATRMCTCMRRI